VRKGRSITRRASGSRSSAPDNVAQRLPNELLSHQIEEGLKKAYDARLADERRTFEAEAARRLASERKQIEERTRKSYDEEHSLRMKSMEEELARKSAQVKELHQAKAEIGRLTREKDEMKDAIEADLGKKMNDRPLSPPPRGGPAQKNPTTGWPTSAPASRRRPTRTPG
jgi:hypothetical protein